MTTEIDITPAHLRCSIGGCPTVNYTPAHLRCGGGASSCPGVTGNGGVLTIVGKQVEHPKAGPGEAAVEIGEGYFSDLPELTRLRKENKLLRGALVEISGHADLGGPWCAAKARSVLRDLGCQASGLQGGEAVSQAEPALHLGAGGEAKRFSDPSQCKVLRDEIGDVVRETVSDDMPILWAVDAIMVCVRQWAEDVESASLHFAASSQRSDEERASAMSANSEHIASLTPIKTHENPPRTAEDQSTAIVQPPDPFGRQ